MYTALTLLTNKFQRWLEPYKLLYVRPTLLSAHINEKLAAGVAA